MLSVRSSVAVLCVLAIVVPLYADVKKPELVEVQDSAKGKGFMYKSDKYSMSFTNADKNQVKVLSGPKNVTLVVDGVIATGEPLYLDATHTNLVWNANNVVTKLPTIISITTQLGMAWGVEKTASGVTGQIVNGTLFVSFVEP